MASRPTDPRSALARSTNGGGRCPPPRQRRTTPRSRHGRMGLATTPAMARHTPRAPRRTAVLHCHRSHARTGWATAAPGADLRRTAARAGVRRRFAPHRLRHAPAVEMAREGVPLVVIQRQLGHSNLGITSNYLQGIDNAEIIDTVHARRAPMVQVYSSLGL